MQAALAAESCYKRYKLLLLMLKTATDELQYLEATHKVDQRSLWLAVTARIRDSASKGSQIINTRTRYGEQLYFLFSICDCKQTLYIEQSANKDYLSL
jgi:hypothetical protein